MAQRIAGEFKNLKNTYEEIAAKTNRQTKIYVVGYPVFVKEALGNCAANVRLDDQERWMLYKGVLYMNQVIKTAAQSAGVHYIDIQDALKDRNLCSEIPGSQMAVNGVTEGDDNVPWYVNIIGGTLAAQGGRPDLYEEVGLSNGGFHPNQNAQSLIKTSLLSQTLGDPAAFVVCDNANDDVCPDTSKKIPLPDQTFFGQGAVSFVNSLNNPVPRAPLVIVQRRDLLQELAKPRSGQLVVEGLLANSQIRAEIQSSPVSLGSFTASSDGTLDQEVIVPDSVPPGFHEIHFFGTNIAGEPVEYYQSVFIAGPAGDVNDNGIPDQQELCGFVEPSYEDHDKDGVDDACDRQIGEPPPPPAPTLPPEEEPAPAMEPELPAPKLQPTEDPQSAGTIELPGFATLPNKGMGSGNETVAGHEETAASTPVEKSNPSPPPLQMAAVVLPTTQTLSPPVVLAATQTAPALLGFTTNHKETSNPSRERVFSASAAPKIPASHKLYVWVSAGLSTLLLVWILWRRWLA